MMVNDVFQVYAYARAMRDIYIEVPLEDPVSGPNVIGKLELCLYGSRDAAKGRQETLSSQLEVGGFQRGVGHLLCFGRPRRTS